MSNRKGDDLKLSQKSRQQGIQQIQGQYEMNGALLRVWTISREGYAELTPSLGITKSI